MDQDTIGLILVVIMLGLPFSLFLWAAAIMFIKDLFFR